ncbi:hypothetical protein [Anaerosporobacter sp.]|uniref:hypothetical protein n=1 Tax=Anaerosporobacter sp. TaxID=1872529 RepID=UPI00286F7D31|nr:hypothetical protein [Anaerosporobacter sp.]
MKTKRIKLLVTLSAVLIILASCGKTSNKDISVGQEMNNTSEAEPESELEAEQEAEKEVELESNETEEIPSLIYLRDGNTEALVGFKLGDAFDYNIFEIAGWSGDGDFFYHLKEWGNHSVHFYFSGKGNRFSGLTASCGDDFFGIKTSEDDFEEIVDILGEPDEYEENVNWDGDGNATYYFEKATLSVRVHSDGIISYIDYRANDDLFEEIVQTEIDTEYDKDLKASHSYDETIYAWEYSELNDTAHYDPYEEKWDETCEENKKTEFIRNYLQYIKIEKTEPDGISYDEKGNPLVEYYLMEDNRICFIIHMWGNYLVDFEADKRAYTDGLYCVILQINKEHKAGNIIYDISTNNNTTCEKLYDAQGKQMANVTYEYSRNVPIPFVIDSWNIDAGYDLLNTLCRNHKFSLYKKDAQFDEAGNLIAYEGSVANNGWRTYLSKPSKCVFGEEGRLVALQESMLAEDIERGWGSWDETIDYSGQIEFNYQKNGNIEKVEYVCSSWTHGTTDPTGRIYYDDKGRMISNDYYVTHGGHVNIFLYEGEEERPWACFYWCSYGNGFEDIYLFE